MTTTDTAATTEEMVCVPRDLLRRVRCDLLLAYTDEHPLTPDVEQMLRQDRTELLTYVPYRFEGETR